MVYLLKKIEKDLELTFDYGWTEIDRFERDRCYCGSKNCNKYFQRKKRTFSYKQLPPKLTQVEKQEINLKRQKKYTVKYNNENMLKKESNTDNKEEKVKINRENAIKNEQTKKRLLKRKNG